ncbi:MAG: glycerate kinase [Bacteroidota bacterium]
MKVLIAPDKFKGSLTALEVCEAIDKGIKSTMKEHHTSLFPLADGGEGTADILTFHTHGRTENIFVRDPLFRPVQASYGISPDGLTAFMEMAQASGLQLLDKEDRNCMITSTFGTGEMIRAAALQGVKRIVLGIGGSATNDAGMGMAEALGYAFLDKHGKKLKPTGENLFRIDKIERESVPFDIEDIQVAVACDVNNPLYGEQGAAFVYAPQKGANAEEVKLLDHGLQNFAEAVERDLNKQVADVPGAGAAGGLGAGALIFLNAVLKSGVELVFYYTDFENQLKQTDLVLTGEGKIDDQTIHGKLIKGICDLAKKHEKPVIAFCGKSDLSEDSYRAIGLKEVHALMNLEITEEQAIENASDYLTTLAQRVFTPQNP